MHLSILIPCYNEAEVIQETYSQLVQVLKKTKIVSYEIIFINDGSTDNTLLLLKRICKENKKVKAISFSRNFGHEAATSAGISFCNGDIAVIFDADLQDPPDLIPTMLDMYEKQQVNSIYGVRKNRKGETILKRISSKLFYRIYNFFSEVKFPKDTGDFRLIDKKIINEFKNLKENKKYVRGLLTWVGFKQVPLYFERQKRKHGKSKYSYRKLFRLAFDIIFSFSKRPLKIANAFGFLCILIGLGLTIYVIISHFAAPLPGWASTLIIIIFFGGVQLLSLGILGEYLSIIFDETKNRPQYIVDEKINFSKKELNNKKQ